jgi:hypothetical protein
MAKSGVFTRPSKRVEEWETVDDEDTAKDRVSYWAEYVTRKGFGKRFGFHYEQGPKGYKILMVDRTIAA